MHTFDNMDLVGSSTGALSPVRPKEGGMVVFDMPNVTSIRVAKFEVRQGGAVYFLVEVVLEGDSCWQWSVEKTFEQFVALHKTLVEKHGVQQDLFPSVGKKQIAQLKVKMINQLQSQLDRYLASVLEVLGLPPRELLDFLEYKYTDVISVTRSLASFAYEHGDMILKEDKVVQITPLQLYCIKRRMVLPVASSETGHMRDDFGNLIDFVQKLHRMKITSPPEHLSDVSISNIAFDLSLFKGLTVLGLEYVRPSQVAGMDSMARQLATLEVHHSIQALQDLLVQCPESDLPLSGLQWTHLTCANFAFNELEAIDASIVMLPSLTRLDLSYNAITKLDNLSELSHLEMVDLSYNCIRSLQGASHQLGHVKELRLSHNQISCLDGIEILTLECVDLSFNQISKEDELHHLTALTSLVELHLHDNPISISKAYKSHVMSRISTAVDRLFLDGKEVSRGECDVHGKVERVWSTCSDLGGKEKLYPVPSKVNSGERLESFDILKHLEKMREEGGERWLSMISMSPEGDLLPLQKHKKKKHGKKKHELSNKVDDGSVPSQPVVASHTSPQSIASNVSPGASILSVYKVSALVQNVTETLCVKENPTPKQPLATSALDGFTPKQSLRDVSSKQLLDDSISKQPLDVPTSKQPLDGPTSKQPLDVPTSKQPLDGPTFKQPLDDSISKQPLDVPTSKQPLDGPTSKQPLDVPTSKQPLDGPTSKQPLDVPTSKQPLDGPTSKQPLDGPTSKQPLDVPTSKQPLDGPTSKQPLDVPTSKQPLDGPTSKQPLDGPTSKQPLDVPTSKQPLDGPTSKQPLDGPTSKQPLDVPTSKQPLDGPTSKQPLDVPTSKQPLDGPTSKQPLDGPTSKQPLDVPTSKQPLNGPTSKQPLDDPIFEQSLDDSISKQPLAESFPRKSSLVGSESQSLESTAQHLNSLYTTAKLSNEALTCTQPLDSFTSLRSSESHSLDEACNGANLKSTDVQSSQLKSSSEIDGPCTDSQSFHSLSPVTEGLVCPVIYKPGIESQEFTEFFISSVAREKHETLLVVEWGTCQLPSCFLCQVETCLLVSDSSLYLLGVIAQSSGQVLWQSKSYPLWLIVQASLDELCQVSCGVNDQYLIFELSHKVSIQRFVMFFPTSERTSNMIANIKAALESVSVDYDDINSSQRAMCMAMENRVLFVIADDSDTKRLKCDLVRDHVCMESVNCTPLGEFVSIDSEFDVKQASSKVAIKHYMVAWELVSDIIPSSNGVCSLQLRALVLTQDSVYLCREDMLSRLVMGSIPLCPSSLLSFVLDCHPISEVTGIKECDKACLLSSPSNPVYQFSIAFGGHGDGTTGSSSGEWVLCVHNSQSMDQFISFLSKAWCGIHGSPLPHGHTTVPLLDPCPRPSLDGEDMQGLRFYTNRALMELCTSSYDRKVEFFKEHVALAEFDKTNEGCLAFFMALCTPNYNTQAEIEVLVVVSNYAIYIVSTIDYIQLWRKARGPSSVELVVSKREKMQEKIPCCFHRIWLSDIKEVTVGLFYLSVQLNTAKLSGEGVVIITQLAESTLALLGAIAGAVDLKDVFEEDAKSDILAEFEDLGSHPIVKRIAGSKLPVKSQATFRQPHLAEGDKLRYLLMENSNKARTSTGSTFGLHILGQQVMLYAEVLPKQSCDASPQCHPHLVLLTNHGLYMCTNDIASHHSPAVFRTQQLRLKKWCPVEQIGRVEIAMADHCIKIYSHLGHKHTAGTHQSDQHSTSSSSDGQKHSDTYINQSKHATIQSCGNLPIIHLIAQNCESVQSFVHLLSLLWSGKNGGKRLTVVRL